MIPLMLWAGAFLGFAVSARNAVAEDSIHRIEITAQQFQYSPNEITVKKGELVVLVLKSMDVMHGLQINALHIDMKVNPGETSEARFRPREKGVFSGHCTTFCGPGHDMMKFKVHVIE